MKKWWNTIQTYFENATALGMVSQTHMRDELKDYPLTAKVLWFSMSRQYDVVYVIDGTTYKHYPDFLSSVKIESKTAWPILKEYNEKVWKKVKGSEKYIELAPLLEKNK